VLNFIRQVSPFSAKPVVAITSLIFDNSSSTTRDVGHQPSSLVNASRPRKLTTTSHQSPNIMTELKITQKPTPRRSSVDVINYYPDNPAMTSSLKHNHAVGKNHRSMSLNTEATIADLNNVLSPGTRPNVKVTASGYDRTLNEDKTLLRQHYHSVTATNNRQVQVSELHADTHTPFVNSGTELTSGGGHSTVSASDIMRMTVGPGDRADLNERVDGAGLNERSHVTAVVAHHRLLRQFQTTTTSTTHGSRKMDSLAAADLSSSSGLSLNENAKHAGGLAMRYTRQPSDGALMLVPTSGLHVDREHASDDVTRISSGKIVEFDSMLERRLYFIDNVPDGPPPSPVH